MATVRRRECREGSRRPHQPHTTAHVILGRGRSAAIGSIAAARSQLRLHGCLGLRWRCGGCLSGESARAGPLLPRCAAAASRPCLPHTSSLLPMQPLPLPRVRRCRLSTCSVYAQYKQDGQAKPGARWFYMRRERWLATPLFSLPCVRPPPCDRRAAGRTRHACTVAASTRYLVFLSVRCVAPQVGGLWRPRKR